MISHQWSNGSISEMNVAALQSFYKGDGHTATVTLLRAIRELLSPTLTTTLTENKSTLGCPAINTGPTSNSSLHNSHHEVLMVQSMTIATSSEDPRSAIRERRKYRKVTSHGKHIASNKERSDSCHSHDLFLYSKPFMIVNSHPSCDANLETATNVVGHQMYVPEICAALLFNLALIHHLAGVKKSGSCGNSSLLKKALLCYDEALHHIRHCTTKVAVLVAAICNNRIHLYHHYFYDSIQGRQQVNLMDYALSYIENKYIPRKVECGCTNGDKSTSSRHAFCVFTDPRKVTQTISGQDLHRFRLTFAFTKMHDFRLSPAA